MSVKINNKPPIENKEIHRICEYYGFIDSEEHFFLITDGDIIILIAEEFSNYNNYNEFDSIEDFLKLKFDTTLVRAYKKNDFDITIDLK